MALFVFHCQHLTNDHLTYLPKYQPSFSASVVRHGSECYHGKGLDVTHSALVWGLGNSTCWSGLVLGTCWIFVGTVTLLDMSHAQPLFLTVLVKFLGSFAIFALWKDQSWTPVPEGSIELVSDLVRPRTVPRCQREWFHDTPDHPMLDWDNCSLMKPP